MLMGGEFMTKKGFTNTILGIKRFKYKGKLYFIMVSIDQAVQSFQALGYERLEGITDYGAFAKTATMQNHTVNTHGSYRPEIGRYELDLREANIVWSDQFINVEQRLNEKVESENFPPQRKMEDIGIDALNQVKRDLDIPDSVSLGDIFVNMNDNRFIVKYSPNIVVSGTDLNQLHETLKTVAEKLGYNI